MADAPTPSEISRKEFEVSRRGFDQQEVRGFLHELSALIERLQRDEAELRERATRAEDRLAATEQPDETAMLELLGEETTRVLTSARDAATDIRSKGEQAAERIISEASAQAAQTRAGAVAEADKRLADARTEGESLLAAARGELDRRTKEAEEAADRIRSEAAGQAQALREDGQRALAAAREEAAALVEAAREEGRGMVAEAQAVRERVLKDLATRRKKARQQIEQLNAGRERLLQAYDVVRTTVEEATTELSASVGDARVAAAAAARRIEAEPEPTVEQLDEELTTARIVHLPIAEPVPFVRIPAGRQAREEAALAERSIPEPADFVEDGGDEPGVGEPEADEPAELPEADEPAELPEADDASAPEAPIHVDAPAEVALDAPPDPTVPEAGAFDPIPSPMSARSAPVADPEPVAAVVEAPEPPAVEAEAEAVSEPEPAVAPEPEPEPEPDPQEPEVAPERAAAVFAQLKTGSDGEPAPGSVADTPPEAEAELTLEGKAFADREAETAPIVRDLARRLKRELADEQNDVLDRLRRAKPAGLDDLFPDADEHAARWARATVTALYEAAAAGAHWSGGGASPTADLADELARGLVLPLRERIERSFVASDGNLDDVADRVRALYREWKNQRLPEAVPHAVVAAYGKGLYDATPSGAKVRWAVDPQQGPCPDCDDNVLAGAIVKGEEFPTGNRFAPAHPGCRCLVLVASD